MNLPIVQLSVMISGKCLLATPNLTRIFNYLMLVFPMFVVVPYVCELAITFLAECIA